jgi:hypothetical protein
MEAAAANRATASIAVTELTATDYPISAAGMTKVAQPRSVTAC